MIASDPTGTPPPPAILRAAPITSIVYDTFWRFAAERQAIYLRRLAGTPGPWTTDAVLAEYKFTNAYRAADRTSQYLIRHVTYEGIQSPRETFFRTLLFKLFNRIETYSWLRAQLGALTTETFSVTRYVGVLDELRRSGRPLYNAAYIMPAPSAAPRKHVGHLELLATMLRDEVPDRLAEQATLGDVFALLRSYPSLGDFLAYQFAIDLNYGASLAFDEAEFVVAGPGAREGIGKCFVKRDGWSDAELICWTAERQTEEFDRLGVSFSSLWGRALQLIDIQNLFCEVAKYARVAHPGFTPSGGRARIKQRFLATGPPVEPWFPPKWGLNDRIGADRARPVRPTRKRSNPMP